MRAIVVASSAACLAMGVGAIAQPAIGSPTTSAHHQQVQAETSIATTAKAWLTAEPKTASTFERSYRAEAIRRLKRSAGGGVVVVFFFGPQVDAIPIPDVTGDRHDDILEARYASQSGDIAVRRGDTGAAAWSASEPGLYGAQVLPSVGTHGSVITFASTFSFYDTPVAYADTVTLHVAARDLKTGALTWSATYAGTENGSPFSYLQTGVPFADGLLTAKAGVSPRVLVEQDSGSYGVACETHPITLDASTGAATPGAPAAGTDACILTPATDLNGDGLDDYVMTTGGSRPAVTAVSSATGAPMWSRSDLTFAYGFPLGTADFTGDKTPDIVFEADSANGADTHVIGLNGATGASVWDKAADYAVPLGDIDHDGRIDFRLVTRPTIRTIRYVGTSGGSGRALWTTVVEAPRSNQIAYSTSYSTGDVNSDGIDDVLVVWISKATRKAMDGSQLDGRTGQQRRIATVGLPYLVSFDGHGTDLVKDTASHGALHLTVVDGATNSTIWRASLRTTAVQLADAYAGHFTGAQDQVVICASGKGGYTAVLDARTGRRLWEVTYPL